MLKRQSCGRPRAFALEPRPRTLIGPLRAGCAARVDHEQTAGGAAEVKALEGQPAGGQLSSSVRLALAAALDAGHADPTAANAQPDGAQACEARRHISAQPTVQNSAQRRRPYPGHIGSTQRSWHNSHGDEGRAMHPRRRHRGLGVAVSALALLEAALGRAALTGLTLRR